MKYTLSELIDIPVMQKLTDSLYAAAGIPSFILAGNGTILTESGWQDICLHFFRRHRKARKTCICTKPDLLEHQSRQAVRKVYQCPHGLMCAMAPIVVNDQPLGSFCTGQFLHHPPNQMEIARFQEHAATYGLDQVAYLQALARVPIIPEEKVESVVEFLVRFAEMIAEKGLVQLNQIKSSQALQRHLDLSQALLDTIPAAVYHKDATGKYQDCNTMFCDTILGLPREKVLGRGLFDLAEAIPPELAPMYHAKDQELLQSGGRQCYEAPVHCAGGVLRDILFHKVVFRDSVDGVQGIVGVMVDITQQKQTERMLQENEQRLTQIINGNSIATIVIDRNHIITHWNRACENLLEMPASAMIGTNGQWRPFYREARPIMADLIVEGASADKIASVYSLWKSSATVDEAYEAEDFFPHLGKEGKWIFFTAAPLKDREGNVIGAIETLQDMTSRKQTEEQLSKARLIAEDASRAKSEFLTAMSHEIRTPMNAIIGMTGLLRETGLTRQQQHYLEVVHTASEHLLALINNVLDFSKIEAKKLELEKAPFNLRELVVDTVALFMHQADEKALVLSSRVDQDVPVYVKGDIQRLRQILVNLIGNALKFTENGWIEVHVGLASAGDAPSGERPPPQTVEPSVCLLFSVQDTGIGIPTTEQERIFASFTQIDGSHQRKAGGTGLGLAITKQLVTLMGGRIWVESRSGWGSRFTFSVWLQRVSPHEFEIADEGPTINDELINRPLHVLVVDDLIVNQEILTSMLVTRGHTVQKVENGEEAVAAVQRERYDLVLMDIQMPVMNGLEAVRRIRALPDEQSAAVPVIALTAHAVLGDRERFLSAGMDAYVSKPVRLEELLRIMREVVHKKSRICEIPSPPVSGLIDLDYALALMDGERDILRKGCEVILYELPQLIMQISYAMQRDDAVTVNRLAHSIKGTARSIKADVTADLAERMELLAGAKQLEEAERLWPDLRENIELVLAELRDKINNGWGNGR